MKPTAATIEAFASPYLLRDERIKAVVTRAWSGAHPVAAGAFGSLGMAFCRMSGRITLCALVVTDRRLLIVRESVWTRRPKQLAAALPFSGSVRCEFNDDGVFPELQVSRLVGLDSDELHVWVPRRGARMLPDVRAAMLRAV